MWFVVCVMGAVNRGAPEKSVDRAMSPPCGEFKKQNYTVYFNLGKRLYCRVLCMNVETPNKLCFFGDSQVEIHLSS